MRSASPAAALTLFLIGLAWANLPGPAAAASASALAKDAQMAFEQQLYRECLGHLESYRKQQGQLGFDLDLLQSRALLRSHLPDRLGEITPQQRDHFLDLVETEPFDDLRARAVIDLVPLRYAANASPRVVAAIGRARGYWESHLAPAEVIDDYRAYFEAQLRFGGRSYTRGPEALRIWKNLVAAELPREQLLKIAVMLQDFRVPGRSRQLRWPNSSSVLELEVAVARFVLDGESTSILQSQAHLVLAAAADRDRDSRQSIEHLEWVRDRAVGIPQSLREAADDRLGRWVQLEARLQCPERFRPGSQHPIQLTWRNARSWRLSIDELDPMGDLRTPSRVVDRSLPGSWQDLTALYEGSSGREVFRLEQPDELELRARQRSNGAQPHLPRQKEVWVDPLDIGLYRVNFTTTGFDGRNETRTRLLRVSRLGMRWVGLGGEDDGRRGQVWIVDMETGHAVGKARGRCFEIRSDRGRRGGPWTHSMRSRDFQTDGSGRADVELATVNGGGSLALVAEHNGEPVLGFQYLAAARNHGSGEKEFARVDAFLWSDRPVYRPGETVHLQAVIRKIFDGSHRRVVPAGAALELVVQDATGSEVSKRKLRLDENGSIDETIGIGREANLGSYRALVRFEDRVFGHSFEVAEVRWPEYAVDVDLDAGFRPVLGDSIHASIRAEYLFGGAVEGRVVVRVLRQPRWRFWSPRVAEWGRSRAIVPEFPRNSPATIASYELSLDQRGEAALVVPTSADGSSAGWLYTIVAEVVDSSGRSEEGRAEVNLSPGALQSTLVSAAPILRPGNTAEILLHVEDNLGQSDVVAGEWILERRGPEEWSVVLRDSVATDANGEAKIRFGVEREGIYRIHALIDDGRSGTSRTSTDLWCAGPRVRQLEGWQDGLRMMAEQTMFLGDRAGVLLLNDVPGTDVLLTTSIAGQVRTRVLRMTGSARWLEFELDDAHRPQFHVHAARAFDFAWAEHSLTIEAPSSSRRLDLALRFENSEHEPGERARLHLKALDADGNAVSTVFALATIDEAVLRVAPRVGMEKLERFGDYRSPSMVPSTPVSTQAGWGFAWYDLEDRQVNEPSTEDDGYGRRVEEFSEFDSMPRVADTLVEKSSREPTAASSGAAAAVEPPTLRTDFRSTAFWGTGITTDAQGEATVEIDMPQTLTRWKALAVAIDAQSRVGTAEADVQTRLPVMVRFEHPRVLREGDRVSMVAVVHNETEQDIEAFALLRGELFDLPSDERSLKVPAHGQAQVEWEALVPRAAAALVLQRDELGRPVDVAPGTTTLRVEVRSEVGSDAVAHDVPVVPMGTPLRVIAQAMLAAPRDLGAVDHDAPTAHSRLDFLLPSDRTMGSDLLLAHVTPSVLGGCIQALPYLAEFPQGCTEQTLSRFVPALAVRAVARQLGLDAERIDPKLDEKIQRGVARISRLMRPDGTWSWWEGGPTNLYMTAYAVRSLAVAHEEGVHRVRSMLQRGARALAERTLDAESLDDRAYALHALALASRQLDGSWAWMPENWNADMLDALYARRDEISPGPRALLALAEEYRGNHDRARSLVRHLGNDLHRAEDGSAYWGDPRATWRGRSAVESTAFVLSALTVIDPQSSWRDDAARWLMLNREGRRWHSTRATAHTILALADHVRQRGQESALRGTVVFRSGSEELGRLEVDLDAVLEGRLTVELDSSMLRDGHNSIAVELLGSGPVWVSLEANTYTRQRRIDASDGALRIERSFTELRPVRTLGGWIARAEDSLDAAELRAGDRVRVRLALHAAHDLDFVRIVDPRPAGLEPMERLSGAFYATGLWGRREVGLRGMEFFLDHLPAGDHELAYELVVERSGEYRAEPARMDGMYLPTRAAHSSSFELDIAP